MIVHRSHHVTALDISRHARRLPGKIESLRKTLLGDCQTQPKGQERKQQCDNARRHERLSVQIDVQVRLQSDICSFLCQSNPITPWISAIQPMFVSSCFHFGSSCNTQWFNACGKRSRCDGIKVELAANRLKSERVFPVRPLGYEAVAETHPHYPRCATSLQTLLHANVPFQRPVWE